MQSSKLALLPGSRPWLRGNISYQAAKRAASRSTTISSSRGYRITPSRGAARAITSRLVEDNNSAAWRAAAAALKIAQQLADFGRVAGFGLRQRRLDDRPALLELERDVLTGFTFFLEFLAPALEAVGPSFDRVTPQPDPIEIKAPDPAVVVEKGQRRFAPRAILVAVFDDGAQLVVPVAKQIGPNFEGIAHDPFDRVAATIKFRIHILDCDPCFRPPQRMHTGRVSGFHAVRTQHPHPERLDHRPSRGQTGFRPLSNHIRRYLT